MTSTPLHTRMLSLRVTWADARHVITDGRILDLRKRGVLPMVGKLQGPGIVHDMAVQIELTFPDLQIVRIQPAMSAFPFAPGPATRGESCPDRLPDVQGLVGRSLRDGYGPMLAEQIGGPRGCFHIFTMLRMLGPTIVTVADRERRGRPEPAARVAAGSPLFARSLIIDGLKGEGLSLVLRGMLFDLHYRPGTSGSGTSRSAAETLPLTEELEASFEATADVQVAIPAMTIATSAARVRRSGAQIETPGDWEAAPIVERLIGRPLLKGYTAQVQEAFSGVAGMEPLQHLLFMLAPAMMQCFPSLAEELDQRPRRVEGPHAAVDSCHMWRAGGPLVSASIWGT